MGWEHAELSYPTLDETKKAIENSNDYKLLSWFRFLPSPRSQEQVAVMKEITNYIKAV